MINRTKDEIKFLKRLLNKKDSEDSRVNFNLDMPKELNFNENNIENNYLKNFEFSYDFIKENL